MKLLIQRASQGFSYLALVVSLGAIMAMVLTAFGQATNTVAGQSPTGVTNFFQVIKPLEFLLIPVVTVFIQLVRKFVPQIPSVIWPYAAPFIGALLDWLASKMGLWSGNPAVGAMLGGLGTWFHQLDANGPNVLGNLLAKPADKTTTP